jgi:diguanylate cyclase (GGDEF)-like protein
LLHVDVDRFKTVNDAYGHVEGDAVLRALAERLQGSIRTSDLSGVGTAGSDSVVARVGANAFTLLLVDVGNDAQAAQVAARLQTAVGMPIALRGRELVLTASIGIAMYPRDAGDTTGLARCAEQAAYAAKSAGRAQHHFFDEAMNVLASDRLARESDLRRAIAEGQLRLHYQPKVDAGSGVILGAEALVRWLHPERGLVPPGQFIPLAEETGLILPLTDWVLETACADLRARRDAGLRSLPISVNLAAPSFVHDSLLAQLDELLQRHRLEATSLVFEVTESLLMTDIERAVERLHALRERGFGLSLDDFGTGYSSLSYLKRFPVHELKIDRSFVVDVCSGGHDGALAASIIALGREFGLRVVAEGVETSEQAAFLLGHGCPHQQGYLFARPMPGEAFDALLIEGVVAERARPLVAVDIFAN